MTITLTEEEAILTRDAVLNYKHELKNSPSERGYRLYHVATSVAMDLDNKINKRRY